MNKLLFCSSCQENRVPEGGVSLNSTRWVCAKCWTNKSKRLMGGPVKKKVLMLVKPVEGGNTELPLAKRVSSKTVPNEKTAQALVSWQPGHAFIAPNGPVVAIEDLEKFFLESTVYSLTEREFMTNAYTEAAKLTHLVLIRMTRI